jgi:hypothetical protein
MAKILHRGKNKIAEPEPVHGFGLGSTKTKAKSPAMEMAHGFAVAVAAARAAEFKYSTEECSKMRGLVTNDKTTELVNRIREDPEPEQLNGARLRAAL